MKSPASEEAGYNKFPTLLKAEAWGTRHGQVSERSFRPAERVQSAVRMTGGVGERETRGDRVRNDRATATSGK